MINFAHKFSFISKLLSSPVFNEVLLLNRVLGLERLGTRAATIICKVLVAAENAVILDHVVATLSRRRYRLFNFQRRFLVAVVKAKLFTLPVLSQQIYASMGSDLLLTNIGTIESQCENDLR